MPTPPPLSLYVHLPWCLRKCPYCDFNSHAIPAGGAVAPEDEERYRAALQADLESALPLVWGRAVRTVEQAVGDAPNKIGQIFEELGRPQS